MINQSKSVFHLHNSLTVIVALGWFYFYLVYEPDVRMNFNFFYFMIELFLSSRPNVSNIIAVYRDSNFIPFSYFLIILFGLLSIRLLSRGMPEPVSRHRGIYYLVSKIFAAASWPYLSMPLLIIVSSGHWPFSLFQGPDTAYARCGFRKAVGFTPPSTINGIYFYSDQVFVGSATYFLKFNFEDERVLEEIVNSAYLELIPKSEINSSNSTELNSHHLSWWPEQITAKCQEVYGYRSKNGNEEDKIRLCFWIDTENQIAYYHRQGR